MGHRANMQKKEDDQQLEQYISTVEEQKEIAPLSTIMEMEKPGTRGCAIEWTSHQPSKKNSTPL